MDPVMLALVIITIALAVLAWVFGARNKRIGAVVLGIAAIAVATVELVLPVFGLSGWLALILAVVGLVLAIVGISLSSKARKPAPVVEPSGSSAHTNGLALASIIVVFFSSVVGLILGHVALSQIRRTGEQGHGMALAAVIIGWVLTGIGVLTVAILLTLVLTRTI